MPTYDYVCEECGHIFEEFESISAKPLEKCPECGGKVHRKIGAGAGLVFKGSGFYITDYKNKSKSTSKTSAKKASKSQKKAS